MKGRHTILWFLFRGFSVRKGGKLGCVLTSTLFGIFYVVMQKRASGASNWTDSVYLDTRTYNTVQFVSTESEVCLMLMLLTSITKSWRIHLPQIQHFRHVVSRHKRQQTDRTSYNHVFQADLECLREQKADYEQKIVVYRICYVSALLFGSEIWSLCTRQEKRLSALCIRYLRIILAINLFAWVYSTVVLTGAKPVRHSSKAPTPVGFDIYAVCRMAGFRYSFGNGNSPPARGQESDFFFASRKFKKGTGGWRSWKSRNGRRRERSFTIETQFTPRAGASVEEAKCCHQGEVCMTVRKQQGDNG